MGMMCKYCTPVSQAGFLGNCTPPPSLPSIPISSIFCSAAVSTAKAWSSRQCPLVAAQRLGQSLWQYPFAMSHLWQWQSLWLLVGTSCQASPVNDTGKHLKQAA